MESKSLLKLNGTQTAWMVGLGVVGFWLISGFGFYQFFTSRYPGANDFYARWRPTRAWLFEGRSPYADSVTLDTQLGMYGRPAKPEEDKGLFSYPMFSMIFFAPFGFFESYALASGYWLAVLFISLIGLALLSFVWSGWRPGLILFAVTLLFSIVWYHSVRTLLLGQFAALEAVLVVAALLAVQQRKDGVAGVLLALATTKIQMAFLIIPGLVLWALNLRRWRLVVGFGLAMLGLLVMSFVFLPTWPFEWQAQLSKYVDNTFIGSPVSIILLAVWPGAGRWVELLISGLLGGYLLWEWWQARGHTGRRFLWAGALTLVITNIVALRTATTNYVMMLPALFLFLRWVQERWSRTGGWLVIGIEAGLFVGIWAAFLLTLEGNVEQPLPYLPLPLFLLVGLWVMRNDWLKPEA
jgi:hypothetical protein